MKPLPPLRDVIDRHGLLAKRSLGQNFILDLNLTTRIAKAAGDLTGINVIEVGPGPGGLTRGLLQTEAPTIHAIERDDRCVAALQELVEAAEGRVVLHADDALKVDYAAICPAPRAIVANLPYNISTTLLVSWLKQLDTFKSFTLMFQREVAERLAAETRTKDYGRLSVLTQWLCTVEHRFDIPPEAFTPAPKVTSSVVHLIPKPRTDDIKIETMERLTAAAFGQRRKMLRQSLKTLGGIVPEDFLAASGVSPTARAEEIDIAGFLRMATVLQK